MTRAAAVAALLLMAPIFRVTASACGGYINVDGHCVPSTGHDPGNYHDRDGTNSHSEHRQGSWSWHGNTGDHHSNG